MLKQIRRILVLAAISTIALPVLADDCSSAAKSAMSNSGHTPKTTTTTTTDSHGKQATSRTVQTLTNKYVQTANGKWYSMGIAIKDLIDDVDTTKLTCRRSGGDSVNGESATTYEIQMRDDSAANASKIWVSSRNLILKSEGSNEGVRFVTVYDYAHVTAPAGAVSMGSH